MVHTLQSECVCYVVSLPAGTLVGYILLVCHRVPDSGWCFSSRAMKSRQCHVSSILDLLALLGVRKIWEVEVIYYKACIIQPIFLLFLFVLFQRSIKPAQYLQWVNGLLIQILPLIFAEISKQRWSFIEEASTKNRLWFAHCLWTFTGSLYCSRWQNTTCDMVPVFCQNDYE